MESIELSSIMANNIIDGKRHIHDNVSTGGNFALSAGVKVGYPCDNAAFEYSSDGALWNPATSILKGGIRDQLVFPKWSFVISSSSNNATVLLEVVIPDPGGDIPVFANTYSMPTLNTDYPFSNTTMSYNGPEAVLYGFRVDITPSNASTIKARSIAIGIV